MPVFNALREISTSQIAARLFAGLIGWYLVILWLPSEIRQVIISVIEDGGLFQRGTLLLQWVGTSSLVAVVAVFAHSKIEWRKPPRLHVAKLLERLLISKLFFTGRSASHIHSELRQRAEGVWYRRTGIDPKGFDLDDWSAVSQVVESASGTTSDLRAAQCWGTLYVCISGWLVIALPFMVFHDIREGFPIWVTAVDVGLLLGVLSLNLRWARGASEAEDQAVLDGLAAFLFKYSNEALLVDRALKVHRDKSSLDNDGQVTSTIADGGTRDSSTEFETEAVSSA